VITGHASVESVIEALRAGVLDYLTKPVDMPRLKAVLANLARTTELKSEIGTLRKQLRSWALRAADRRLTGHAEGVRA